MKLLKNNIFALMLTFMVLVDLLVAFDLKLFYARATLSFLFITLIPGLLIMLIMKIRTLNFWEYLVYSVGLSISFIMFAGLAVNWILPWLNITNQPLAKWPILICFNIFLIIMWIIALKRNKDLKPFKIQFPQLDLLNSIMFTIPLLFPILAILGAFLLNNHGPNILTMIMLGGIALYILAIVILRDKLNENIYPWALYLIGLGLLFSGWMRGLYVSGPDISLEKWVFSLTEEKQSWALSNFKNTYNAMLSLTILPTIISRFVELGGHLLFKILLPLYLSLIPLVVYLISKKYLQNFSSFLSGILFLSLPGFLNWYSNPIRQAIAFLFFGLFMLALIKSHGFSENQKKILLILFGFTMILSHYSTSYIGLFLLIIIFICQIIKSLRKDQKRKIPGIIIILLLLFGFFWYSQITPTSEGPINFMKKSFDNLGKMFEEDVRQGTSADPLFGLFKKSSQQDLIQEYENKTRDYEVAGMPEGFSKEETSRYRIRYMPSKTLPLKLTLLNSLKLNYILKQFLSKIFQLFILIGLLSLLLSKKADSLDKSIYLGAGIILVLLVLLPFFSISYGMDRFIQQMFILLAPISIGGGLWACKKIRQSPEFFLAILIIIFFILFSGLLGQLTGGDEAKAQLNNFGRDYDVNHMSTEDYNSAAWLDKPFSTNTLYADSSAGLKLNSYGFPLNSERLNKHIIPKMITKDSHIYASTTNSRLGLGFFSIRGFKLSYNFPTHFLNSNKNKVYANGGSEIFK